MGSMFSAADLDAAINREIAGTARARKAETTAMLQHLAAQLEGRTSARKGVVDSYSAAMSRLKEQGKSDQSIKSELRFAESDYDGADASDAARGAWLTQLSALPASLEETVAAVIKAVVSCHDLKSCMAMFDADAKADPAVVKAKGVDLIKSYYGGSK